MGVIVRKALAAARAAPSVQVEICAHWQMLAQRVAVVPQPRLARSEARVQRVRGALLQKSVPTAKHAAPQTSALAATVPAQFPRGALMR